MPLFNKAKTSEVPEQTPQIDVRGITDSITANVLNALKPVLQALAVRQAVPETELVQQDFNDPAQLEGLITKTVQRILQTEVVPYRDDYVSNSQQTARRLFYADLEPDEREVYKKHEREVDEIINNLGDEKLRGRSESYERAFKYVLTNHPDDFVSLQLKKMEAKDLPPHLQTPGGIAPVTAEVEPKLTEEEKFFTDIFAQTSQKPESWTGKKFEEFRDMPFETLDKMIERHTKANVKPATPEVPVAN